MKYDVFVYFEGIERPVGSGRKKNVYAYKVFDTSGFCVKKDIRIFAYTVPISRALQALDYAARGIVSMNTFSNDDDSVVLLIPSQSTISFLSGSRIPKYRLEDVARVQNTLSDISDISISYVARDVVSHMFDIKSELSNPVTLQSVVSFFETVPNEIDTDKG